MFKRFLSFTKGYRFLTILCPFMIYLDVLVELEIPKAMGRVVDVLYTIEPGVEESRAAVLKELSGELVMMLLLCAVTLIIGYIAARCSAIASMGFGANLRRELFNKTQDLSFDNINKIKISSLITRMTSDVSQVQNVYKNNIGTLASVLLCHCRPFRLPHLTGTASVQERQNRIRNRTILQTLFKVCGTYRRICAL